MGLGGWEGLQPWCGWERGGLSRRREGEEMATEKAAFGFVAVRKRKKRVGELRVGCRYG